MGARSYLKARWRVGTLTMSFAILSGCALTFGNAEPARELKRESAPSGSVYVGWRVYEDRCARCHGADASGSAHAPDLLASLREMGARRFVDLVLLRYDWAAAPPDAARDEAGRTALVEDMLAGKETALAMPAWQDEPAVSAHILDLYAYLAARADGVQGPGRPQR
jgi:mono/diheme cytochrome c family protein